MQISPLNLIILISALFILVALVVFFFRRSMNRLRQAEGELPANDRAISHELLRKVTRIEISTRNIVNEVFSGEYHSVFKGRGMEFAEVREYQPGDDVRNIDWNVSARMGHPFIKMFEEERELTVMLLVDVSSSGSFGTTSQEKRELAAELSAVLAFSAIQNNDKVGLIIFSDQIEKFIPPRKGKTHVLRVIREILYYKPKDSTTDISKGLEFLNRVIKRKSTVFLISDFLSSGFEKALQIANKKHDIIALRVADPRELEMPDIGLIEFEDAETGQAILLDTGNRQFRSGFSKRSQTQSSALNRFFKSIGVDHIDIFTGQSYVRPITRFFRMRARRLAG